jgi:hypothetical protein
MQRRLHPVSEDDSDADDDNGDEARHDGANEDDYNNDDDDDFEAVVGEAEAVDDKTSTRSGSGVSSKSSNCNQQPQEQQKEQQKQQQHRDLIHLCCSLLQPVVADRLSAREALQHGFLLNGNHHNT